MISTKIHFAKKCEYIQEPLTGADVAPVSVSDESIDWAGGSPISTVAYAKG